MKDLSTIEDIFKSKALFRIPSYQRGYSWETTHLNDLWLDLENLRKGRKHYMDVISVEMVKDEETKLWKEDQWLFEERSISSYYIVDGQQRVTTLLILLWEIISRTRDGKKLAGFTKSELIRKYIYVTGGYENNQKSYKLAYEVDDPSFNYLKKIIFDQEISDSQEIINTIYTNNLKNAKDFFRNKVNKIAHDHDELNTLFRKITERLLFNFNHIGSEFDIFVVFETKNNRGKSLSYLEKLKNRLIYLSTLLDEKEDKVKIKKNITNTWKDIYLYLGRNTANKLDDDNFLRNHWIMYGGYDRKVTDFYAVELFQNKFTVSNTVNEDVKSDKRIIGSVINDYVDSLRESVRQWFAINNPIHEAAKEILNDKEISSWLLKLGRLGFRAFSPIILATFVKKENSTELKIQLLKKIEQYIFLLYCVSGRRSNTGTYHFYSQARRFYNGDTSIKDLIQDIENWIHGEEDYSGYYNIDGFYSLIKDNYIREGKLGYMGWGRWLRYFLFEYEEYLSGKMSEKGWDKSFGHVELIENVKRNLKPPYKKSG